MHEGSWHVGGSLALASGGWAFFLGAGTGIRGESGVLGGGVANFLGASPGSLESSSTGIAQAVLLDEVPLLKEDARGVVLEGS